MEEFEAWIFSHDIIKQSTKICHRIINYKFFLIDLTSTGFESQLTVILIITYNVVEEKIFKLLLNNNELILSVCFSTRKADPFLKFQKWIGFASKKVFYLIYFQKYLKYRFNCKIKMTIEQKIYAINL